MLEGLGSALAILWEREYFCLECGANARNSVPDLLTFLKHQNKNCLDFYRTIEFFQLKIALVEAGQHLAS